MEKKAVSGIMLTLLLISMLTLAFNISLSRAELSTVNSSDSLSPGYYETSEFLIGSVAVGVIFPQSNGSIDPSTEDWSSYEESLVMTKIRWGLNWLAAFNPSAHVSFSIEVHYRVPTSYEPISRSFWDHGLWITEAVSYLGYPSVLDCVNDLRNRLGTDWAFLIFVVDSSNDADGRFTDGIYAHGPIGGPYQLMTYDGPLKGGITSMPIIIAHETLHLFYATDEYNSKREYSGYLNISDNDFARCLMRDDYWALCYASKEQIGWRDTDHDGILDIVDTFPETALNLCLPNPTTKSILTYTGFVTEVPYQNRNPYTYTWPDHCMTFFPIPRTQRNITINTITSVEYRIDYGVWKNATAADGAFDEAQEDFMFVTPSLTEGNHVIEVRGKNSVGNIETECATDIVTIIPKFGATLDIAPDTLNLVSNGQWITAYIEFPASYDVNNIDVSTIMLNGTIPIDITAPIQIGDYDRDGIPDLMVKFDKAAASYIAQHVQIGGKFAYATLTIAGNLSDGALFSGSCTIKVTIPRAAV